MPNISVRNVIIVDGTGREGFRGSVHVVGDKIKAVIPSNAAEADDIGGAEIDDIIDAEGLVVAPGLSIATVISTGCCRCAITKNSSFP